MIIHLLFCFNNLTHVHLFMHKKINMSNKVAVPPTKDALLKSYRKRLKDDIGSMVANFTEIIKLCQIGKSEEESQVSRSTLSEEEAFEMQVRAANMVRSTSIFMGMIDVWG